jgi:hypothetical protein
MRWLALLLLLTAGCVSAEAPIAFGPRPRLAYTRAELDAWLADPARQAQRERHLAQADKLVERGLVVPEGEGQWIFYYACQDDEATLKPESATRHLCPKCGKAYTDERTVAAYRTKLYYQLDHELYHLAVAYALTGHEKYAEAVRSAFLKLTAAYPRLERHDRWGRRGILAVVGGRRYAQHLDEAVSAIELAKAYDLVAEAPVWKQGESEQVAQQFLGAMVREIRGLQWAIEAINNHQTWFNAAYANVGVAIGDAELVRAAFQGKPGLLWQLDHSVTADGLWYEGTMAYHFYALSAIQETLDAGRRVGIDLAANARLQSLWRGPLAFTYPNGEFPVLNDSDPGNLNSRKGHYEYARRYFGDESFALDGTPRPQASADLPGIGVVALRRGTGDAATCAFLDYGMHGGHHGHPDKLNFTLYALGHELLVDPGRISYSVPEYQTWCRTTVAHNTVVVGRQDQQPTTGRLLQFSETADYAAAIATSDGAYPGATLTRALLLGDGWLLDVFRVTTVAPTTLDWVVHPRGKLDLEGTPAAAAALGSGPGYQHLTAVRSQAQATRFVFTQPTRGALVLTTWPALSAWTGQGIGYRLTDAVPFVLRRAEGSEAVFVALYDLSGSGTAATLGEVTARGATVTVRLTVGATARGYTLDLDPATTPATRIRAE